AWLDIFMLTPTHSYVMRHFGGSWEAVWEHLRRFEAVVPPALPDLAARTGYMVRAGEGHHMMLKRVGGISGSKGWLPFKEFVPFRELFAKLRSRRRFRFVYNALTSESRRPLNVLGLGRSARSVLFGVAAFAARDPQDNPAVEGPADYVGNTIDVADEARAFLTHLLRDTDTVERAEFRQIFGGDMSEVIPTALAGWAKDGTARLENDVLRFVPQDRQARMRSLLWLVPGRGDRIAL